MLERTASNLEVRPSGAPWAAFHSLERLCGPDRIEWARTPLVQDCRFYVDDLTDQAAIVKQFRDFRKGGAGVVETHGYFPFGNEIGMVQNCRYAANHMRVATDLEWPRDTTVKRHLGFRMTLPGLWKRMLCVPPALHLAEGAATKWVDLPEGGEESVMVGHWHRPPLALVFERIDGVRVELGTGMDIWRWEHCLGHGPESGSYKVFADSAGIRIVREPLMCCEAFLPEPRCYRFNWYMAWGKAEDSAGSAASAQKPLAFTKNGVDLDSVCPAKDGEMVLDLRDLGWQSFCGRTGTPADNIRGERQDAPCMQSSATQKPLRRVIRQLAALEEPGKLCFRNLTPGPCWDARHLNRRNKDGLGHWDMHALLDIAVWARQQLGPDWQLHAEPAGIWGELPSFQGLFAPNGFED